MIYDFLALKGTIIRKRIFKFMIYDFLALKGTIIRKQIFKFMIYKSKTRFSSAKTVLSKIGFASARKRLWSSTRAE